MIADTLRTITEAKSRFQALVSGDSQAVPPSLRSAVFNTVVSEGGEAGYQSVKREYINTTSIDGKEICLSSLGFVTTPELVNDCLDFRFSDTVPVQDKFLGCASIASNGKARGPMWIYLKGNWGTISKIMSVNSSMLNRLLQRMLSKFASHEMEEDVKAFFQGKDTTGFDRGLVQIQDSIRSNANYRERDEALVSEWLRTHRYAK